MSLLDDLVEGRQQHAEIRAALADLLIARGDQLRDVGQGVVQPAMQIGDRVGGNVDCTTRSLRRGL